MKQPVLVEIIGEAESGKSHASILFPKVKYIDTTAKKEGLPIIMKLLPDWKQRYVWARSFEEVMVGVKKAVESDEFKTVVIDTSTDLQRFAARWWEAQGKKLWSPEVGPVLFGKVRDEVDKIIETVINAEKNVVMTSQMKDEYVKKEATGKRIRDGYKRLFFQADLRVYFSLEEELVSSGAVPTKRVVRKCRVVKNRFVDKAGSDWVEYLPEFSYEELMVITKLPRELWVV